MAQQLYPPYIEGKIPAQIGDTLCIPYQLNRTVGAADAEGENIVARIKQVTTNRVVATITTKFENNSRDGVVYYANFAAPADSEGKSLLWVGQYYKIQLAFEGSNVYSTIGIFKYTELPSVSIDGLEAGKFNGPVSVLRGEYIAPSGDITEKEREYKFDIFSDNELIESSGWQVHNTNSVADVYTIEANLFTNKYYTISYTAKTVNDLEVSSPLYFSYGDTDYFPLHLPAECGRVIDDKDGCVSVGVMAQKENLDLVGTYRLLRLSDNEQAIIADLTCDTRVEEMQSIELVKDYTAEQGKEYSYYLQQYHNELYSTPFLLGNVIVDFEDMFLCDGERSLKIRFNPKVSSFKTTTLETKTDSIGGQYPIFYRNGQLAYKDFPISGLISYQMDENNLFIKEEESEVLSRINTPSEENMVNYKSTDLTSENIKRERLFKLQALEWLNNGQPKLFRSPTEGNYVVRLMNVNLSPNDTLGRMLHTFNANAYEIAPCTSASLQKYGILKKQIDILSDAIRPTINIVAANSPEYLIPNAAYARVVENGSKPISFQIRHANGLERIINVQTNEYNITIYKDNPLVSIKNIGEYDFQLEYGLLQREEYPIIRDGKQVVGVEIIEAAEQLQRHEYKPTLVNELPQNIAVLTDVQPHTPVEIISTIDSDEGCTGITLLHCGKNLISIDYKNTSNQMYRYDGTYYEGSTQSRCVAEPMSLAHLAGVKLSLNHGAWEKAGSGYNCLFTSWVKDAENKVTLSLWKSSQTQEPFPAETEDGIPLLLGFSWPTDIRSIGYKEDGNLQTKLLQMEIGEQETSYEPYCGEMLTVSFDGKMILEGTYNWLTQELVITSQKRISTCAEANYYPEGEAGPDVLIFRQIAQPQLLNENEGEEQVPSNLEYYCAQCKFSEDDVIKIDRPLGIDWVKNVQNNNWPVDDAIFIYDGAVYICINVNAYGIFNTLENTKIHWKDKTQAALKIASASSVSVLPSTTCTAIDMNGGEVKIIQPVNDDVSKKIVALYVGSKTKKKQIYKNAYGDYFTDADLKIPLDLSSTEHYKLYGEYLLYYENEGKQIYLSPDGITLKEQEDTGLWYSIDGGKNKNYIGEEDYRTVTLDHPIDIGDLKLGGRVYADIYYHARKEVLKDE